MQVCVRGLSRASRAEQSVCGALHLLQVVRLFCYLSDKDIFAEFYKKQLAKRLLLARSSSDDAERAMIAKLKLRCGAQFTSKARAAGGVAPLASAYPPRHALRVLCRLVILKHPYRARVCCLRCV